MMLNPLKLFVFLTVFLPFTVCFAQADYFSAEVPVESQSRSEQRKAAKSGLLDVLVRVSGSEAVLDNPVIAQRSSSALSLVTQFQYEDVDQEELSGQGFEHILRLSFSSRLVRQLLASADLPVWSVNRPKTLVWLVEDSFELGKRMMPFDETNPMIQGIQRAAAYRGLPLTFPLLDFDDQIALGAERLWNLDEASIMDASERYKADAVLVGKYTLMSSGLVLSSWQYFHRDKSRFFDLRSQDPKQLGYDALLPLADHLASLYSYRSLDSEYFSVSVLNVRNFSDYRELVSMLKSFDTITDVKIDRVIDEQVDLRLKSEASLSQISNQIALARKLVAFESSTTGDVPKWQRAELGSPQNPLLYRLRR